MNKPQIKSAKCAERNNNFIYQIRAPFHCKPSVSKGVINFYQEWNYYQHFQLQLLQALICQ